MSLLQTLKDKAKTKKDKVKAEVKDYKNLRKNGIEINVPKMPEVWGQKME